MFVLRWSGDEIPVAADFAAARLIWFCFLSIIMTDSGAESNPDMFAKGIKIFAFFIYSPALT